ncbi:MAG: GntR family transcriptional regulator [Hyphomicrobiales bacterium]
MLKPALTDKAYQQIRDWIVRYHLKPGVRLHVSDLAHSLRMSQTPVREALSMLAKEHLIEREPHKGFRVSALNLQAVEDLYDLRTALEALAAGQAARRMSLSDQKRLIHLLAEVGRLIKNGSKQRILDLEQDFHLIILEASGNKTLAEMGRAILDRIWIIQNINLMTTDHLSYAHPQHVKVFQAIERGDSYQASVLMKRHITSAKEFVLSRLKRSDDVFSNLMMGLPCLDEKTLRIARRPRTSSAFAAHHPRGRRERRLTHEG